MNLNPFNCVSEECSVTLEINQSWYGDKMLSVSICITWKNIGLSQTSHLFYYLQIIKSTQDHGQQWYLNENRVINET